MLIAGGTDLLPNMKRRHQTPKVLVVFAWYRGTQARQQWFRSYLGSALTLTEITRNDKVRANATALYQLPRRSRRRPTQHGTIGGNLCLDTRCTYYNQNYEWRKAIDFCLKKDGEPAGWLPRASAAWPCRRPTPRPR